MLGHVGSCLPDMTRLFLTGKKGHVELPGYFRITIVSDLITHLAMFVYRLIVNG